MANRLTDTWGRNISYLRLSVTDRCDLRCVYCMAEDMQFLPRKEVLSADDIINIVAAFTALGVQKVRLTGGEPLIRRDILAICQGIKSLPDAPDLVLSTNGTQLHKLAGPLFEAGVSRLNVSLDSVDPEHFRQMSRVGDLQQVLNGIAAAKHAGFQRIKLNSVVLQDRNDQDILSLVEYARTQDLNISFIEEMPLGQISSHERSLTSMSNARVRALIEQRWALTPTTESSGGPARYYRMPDSETRIGFISPHTHNFCDSCNRVRITAEGKLVLCLGHENAIDLKPYLQDAAALQDCIIQAMALKPERHQFDLNETKIVRFMNMTGG